MPEYINPYDQGWNAFSVGYSFDSSMCQEWQDGYMDAMEASQDELEKSIPTLSDIYEGDEPIELLVI